MDIYGIIGIYLIALMVFYANPLNDPLKATSTMNFFHRDNVRLREFQAATIEEHSIIIEWPPLAPHVSASFVNLLCLIINGLVHIPWLHLLQWTKAAGFVAGTVLIWILR